MLTIPYTINNNVTNTQIYNQKKLNTQNSSSSYVTNYSDVNYVQQFQRKTLLSYEGRVQKYTLFEIPWTLSWDYKTDGIKISFEKIIWKFWDFSKYSLVESPFLPWAEICDFQVVINNNVKLKNPIIKKLWLRDRIYDIKLNEEINSYSSFDKQIKFSEIKTISIELDISLFVNFVKRPPHKYSDVVVFNAKENKESLKDIKLDPKTGTKKINVQNGIKFSSSGSYEKKYQKLEIKSLELKQGKHNKEFLSITGAGSTPFNRVNIIVKELSGLPFSSEKRDKVQPYLKDNSKIGTNQFMYYDFDKEEVINGGGNNADNGYVIPYTYSGTMYLMCKLDLNEYKDIKLYWKQKIEQPYFNKTKGSVIKLKLKETNTFNPEKLESWLNIQNDFFFKEENKNLNYKEFLQKLNEKKY